MTWAMKIADERDEAYAIGREEGISVGLEQGTYKNKLETAKTMLSEGLDSAMVSRCTNLPLKTIQELRDEINKESLHAKNSSTQP